MRNLIIVLSLVLAASSARALEYVPVYSFTLLGGQYFFTSDKSNLNANTYLNITPAVKLSESWSVLPTLSSSFNGTKSVLDSVGSSSLFQQGMDHRLSVGGLYLVPDSPWKVKPSISYKRSFLKETKDEKWGYGLFDYQTYGAGIATEKVYREPFSYRFGYDFYFIKFHNYQSLESQSGVDPSGNPLGRETAGTNVLDTFNHEFSVSASRPFPYKDPKVSLTSTYRWRWQIYKDQPIIAKTGEPTDHSPTERQDFMQTLDLTLGYPRAFRGGALRLGSSWATIFNYNGSNQNSYDAAQSRYTGDSYSYLGLSLGPRFNLSWGDRKNPSAAGLAFTYSRTKYLGRRTQDSYGSYGDDLQYQDRFLMTLSYGYPIAANFRLTAQTNFLWARSNNNYEAAYRYNYSTANYLMGFTYNY